VFIGVHWSLFAGMTSTKAGSTRALQVGAASRWWRLDSVSCVTAVSWFSERMIA
jgi:hypothetical protein